MTTRGALEALDPLLDSRVGAMPRYADVTARALHAELCLHDGRMDRAHAVIAEVLRHWPESDEPLLTLARLYLADGRPAAAAQVADRVLDNGPGSLVTAVSATVLLAQALRQLGDLAGASDQLDQALRMAGPEGVRRPFQGHATWIAEVLASPPVPTVTRPRELERRRSGLPPAAGPTYGRPQPLRRDAPRPSLAPSTGAAGGCAAVQDRTPTTWRGPGRPGGVVRACGVAAPARWPTRSPRRSRRCCCTCAACCRSRRSPPCSACRRTR